MEHVGFWRHLLCTGNGKDRFNKLVLVYLTSTKQQKIFRCENKLTYKVGNCEKKPSMFTPLPYLHLDKLRHVPTMYIIRILNGRIRKIRQQEEPIKTNPNKSSPHNFRAIVMGYDYISFKKINSSILHSSFWDSAFRINISQELRVSRE